MKGDSVSRYLDIASCGNVMIYLDGHQNPIFSVNFMLVSLPAAITSWDCPGIWVKKENRSSGRIVASKKIYPRSNEKGELVSALVTLKKGLGWQPNSNMVAGQRKELFGYLQ